MRLSVSPTADQGFRAGQPQAQKLLLTQREAAAALSISTRTLFSLIKAGKLRSVRIGSGGVRIAVSELNRFIFESEVR